MATQPTNTKALATTGEKTLKVTGAFRDAKDVTARLQFAAQNYHLISPATACGAVPEGCSIALSTVLVDIEAETYDQGGKRGLGKTALDKIAAAAGISWDARLSGRLDDGSDANYCMWRAIGTLRHLDGTIVQLVGSKEMDLRPGSPQVLALEERAAAKKRDASAQIREMRLHIVAHAESKARLRAIRSLGVRSAYSRDELKKPFVIAKIMWTGQSDDPELRRAFAMKQADAMLSGTRSLYGETAPAPLPSVAGMPRLGARRPPPIGSSIEDDGDVVDATANTERAPAAQAAPPPSEPKNGAAPAPADGPVAKFGKSKGHPITSMSDEDLDWYAGAIRKSVDDPEKSRYRASNEAHLKEVLAELERRNGVPPDAAADAAAQGADQFDEGDFAGDDETPF